MHVNRCYNEKAPKPKSLCQEECENAVNTISVLNIFSGGGGLEKSHSFSSHKVGRSGIFLYAHPRHAILVLPQSSTTLGSPIVIVVSVICRDQCYRIDLNDAIRIIY